MAARKINETQTQDVTELRVDQSMTQTNRKSLRPNYKTYYLTLGHKERFKIIQPEYHTARGSSLIARTHWHAMLACFAIHTRNAGLVQRCKAIRKA